MNSLSVDSGVRYWSKVLAFSVATTLLIGLVGTFLVAPSVGGATRPASSWGEWLLLLSLATGAVTAWVAALRHAWLSFGSVPFKRAMVLLFLICGNFFGAVVYLLATLLLRHGANDGAS